MGWAMSARITARLANDALMMAIWKRKPPKGLMVHSDRGSQYASDLYQKTIRDYDFICSMSRKGNCWDNAPSESFFHTLKTELTHHRRYQTRQEAKQEIFEYIECSITARDATQRSAIRHHWAMNKRVEKLRDFLSGKVLPYHYMK